MGVWKEPFIRVHTPRGVRIVRPGQRASIGRRETNTIVLACSTVSSVHAELMWPDDEARPSVVDLESRNGTRLNGKRIRKAVLPSQGTIRVGACSLEVEVLHCADETPAVLEDSDDLLSSPFDDRPAVSGLLLKDGDGVGLLLDLERERRTGSFQLGRHTVLVCMGKILLSGAQGRAVIDSMANARAGSYYQFNPTFELQSYESSALYWPSSLLRNAG